MTSTHLKRNTWTTLGLIAVGTAIVIAAGAWWAYPPRLIIEGEMDARTITLAPKSPARVAEVFIDDGASVEAGEQVIRLESPELQAKLEQAEAAHFAALAQLAEVESGTRVEDIDSALAQWKEAETKRDYLRKQHERMVRLLSEEAIPVNNLDEIRTQYEAAIEATSAAKAQYDKALAGARPEERMAVYEKTRQAAQQVAEVKAYIDDLDIIAPQCAEAETVNVKPGELVWPGEPLVSLVDLNDAWAVFYLREDLLKNIRMGSRFTAKVPALGISEIVLEVDYIAPMGEYATWNATKTSGEFDLKTFEVHARPVEPVEGLRPGMSVIVNDRLEPE